MADDDRPVRVRRRQNMIRAVNAELKTFPEVVRKCATTELARQLARELDAGDRAAAGELRRTLAELRKLAKQQTTTTTTTDDPAEDGADELDDIARAAAARVARAAGVVRPLDADVRRRGGRSAG